MELLFLPFRTRRTHPLQGCLSRQLPQYLAAKFSAAGIRAQFEPIFAYRGAAVAHTVVEFDYPQQFLDERREHFDAIVVGRSWLLREPSQVSMAISIFSSSSVRPLAERSYKGEPQDVLDEGAKFISEILSLPRLGTEQSTAAELMDLFLRRDKETLEAESFQAQTRDGAG